MNNCFYYDKAIINVRAV